MSQPISVYFVRDMHFVGKGYGNLEIDDDAGIPCAIFDAWHSAVEFFEPGAERWKEQHTHLFTTREQLFEYQYVIIPQKFLIISRQIVHDLLMQRMTTQQFLQVKDNPAFELTDEVYVEIATNTANRYALVSQ